MKPKPLSPKLIKKLAEKAVLKVTSEGLTGAIAHKAAYAKLAKAIDKALKWPPTPLGLLAETLDGPAAAIVIRLLGGFVENAYRKLKKKAKRKK